jgi:hypothetical protein
MLKKNKTPLSLFSISIGTISISLFLILLVITVMLFIFINTNIVCESNELVTDIVVAKPVTKTVDIKYITFTILNELAVEVKKRYTNLLIYDCHRCKTKYKNVRLPFEPKLIDEFIMYIETLKGHYISAKSPLKYFGVITAEDVAKKTLDEFQDSGHVLQEVRSQLSDEYIVIAFREKRYQILKFIEIESKRLEPYR